MTELQKLFVPYELALKLKEKGFDEPCLARYHRIEPVELRLCVGRMDFTSEKSKSQFNSIFIEDSTGRKTYPFYSAPLYQQVIDWLRKHGIHIDIEAGEINGENFPVYYYQVYRSQQDRINYAVKMLNLSEKEMEDIACNDYYKTLTTAIDEALKLI